MIIKSHTFYYSKPPSPRTRVFRGLRTRGTLKIFLKGFGLTEEGFGGRSPPRKILDISSLFLEVLRQITVPLDTRISFLFPTVKIQCDIELQYIYSESFNDVTPGRESM